jgi:hypothetical protein
MLAAENPLVRSPLFAVAILLSSLAMAPAIADDDASARAAARRFGQALVASRSAELRPLLPSRGKVLLTLHRFGPEEGYFGASQVEAVFRDFLAVGAVRSFEVLRLESDGSSFALAHGRAVLTDRQGRPARVGLHLAFQPENDHWVLREIKELSE